MASDSTLTVRVSKDLKKRLESLAARTERSKAFHTNAALEDYLSRNAWQIEAIHEGIAAADAGRLVSHEKVGAFVKSLVRGKASRTRNRRDGARPHR